VPGYRYAEVGAVVGVSLTVGPGRRDHWISAEYVRSDLVEAQPTAERHRAIGRATAKNRESRGLTIQPEADDAGGLVAFCSGGHAQQIRLVLRAILIHHGVTLTVSGEVIGRDTAATQQMPHRLYRCLRAWVPSGARDQLIEDMVADLAVEVFVSGGVPPA